MLQILQLQNISLIASISCSLPFSPFDVVKTRMQQARERQEEVCELDVDFSEAECIQAENDNNIGTILKQISDEGYHVFFSGWYERCLRSCIQFGVTLSLFELLNMKASELGML